MNNKRILTSSGLLFLFYAGSAAAAPAPGGGAPANALITNVAFFAFIFILFYVLLLAPQRKQQKQHQEMLRALKPGDKVVTKAGIKGVVSAVRDDEDFLSLKVADNVKIEVYKDSVERKLEENKPS